MKREEYKDVDISDRKWRIEKFDALTGSYIAFTIMTKMLPVMSGIKSDDAQAAAMGLMQSKVNMTKEEFISFQKDCLSVCSEVQTLPNGQQIPMPVLSASGSFGPAGLDKDVITVLALTVHSIMFNVSGFFDGNALSSVMGGPTAPSSLSA